MGAQPRRHGFAAVVDYISKPLGGYSSYRSDHCRCRQKLILGTRQSHDERSGVASLIIGFQGADFADERSTATERPTPG